MYIYTKYFPFQKALKFKVNYPVTLGLIALGLCSLAHKRNAELLFQ